MAVESKLMELATYDLNIKNFKAFNLKVFDVIVKTEGYILKTDIGDVLYKRISCNPHQYEFTCKLLDTIEQKITFLKRCIKNSEGVELLNVGTDNYCFIPFGDSDESDFSMNTTAETLGEKLRIFHDASEDLQLNKEGHNVRNDLTFKLQKSSSLLWRYDEYLSTLKEKSTFHKLFSECAKNCSELSEYAINLIDATKYIKPTEILEIKKLALCHCKLNPFNFRAFEGSCFFYDFSYAGLDYKITDILYSLKELWKKDNKNFENTTMFLKSYLGGDRLGNINKSILIAYLIYPSDFYKLCKKNSIDHGYNDLEDFSVALQEFIDSEPKRTKFIYDFTQVLQNF